jgi:hypothetical protein
MPEGPTASRFPPTVWSVIVAAGDRGNPRSGRALEQICSGYWRPIYMYVRGRGHPREQAEDLTQGFSNGSLRRTTSPTSATSEAAFVRFCSRP